MFLPRCLSSLTSVSVARLPKRTLLSTATAQCSSCYSTVAPKGLAGDTIRRQNRYLQTAVHRPSTLLESGPPPSGPSSGTGSKNTSPSGLTSHPLYSNPPPHPPRAPLQSQSQARSIVEPASPSATSQTTPPASKTPAAAAAAAASTPTSTSPAPAKSKLRAPRKAAMTLTPSAITQLRDLLNSPDPKLIRVGVKNRGCSGLAYHLEYTDKPGKFDEQVEQDGVKVLIDSKALFSIIGSEMDWVEDKLSARFVFKNPNIKEQCGCGESFMVGA
ncbi:iron sulfur assembly protein 1 [Peziza echinospora]|nr:iron sulfur assembly protein 1 [Peziza echinospora]